MEDCTHENIRITKETHRSHIEPLMVARCEDCRVALSVLPDISSIAVLTQELRNLQSIISNPR